MRSLNSMSPPTVPAAWRRVAALAATAGLVLAGCAAGAPAGERQPTRATPTASASASSAAAGGVHVFGTMTVTRAAHTATLLRDGRVLLAGGCAERSCEGVTATTELFDPSTGESTPGPEMLEPRVGHAAISRPDGSVLILGGFGQTDVTATTEVYDPTEGRFRSGPTLAVPRVGATVAALEDGTILVAGGFDGREALASAELLEPAAGKSRATGSMLVARASQAGATLADGSVLVTGGSTGRAGGPVQATAEVYDPGTQTWSATGDMTSRRHKHGVVLLEDGRVLVAGGSDERDGHGVYSSAEIYDPASGAFTAAGDMGSPRYKFLDAVVRLADGRVLLAGGAPTAELFDPAAQAFSPVPGELAGSRSFAAAVPLPDGVVLVTGGYDETITLTDEVARYVPDGLHGATGIPAP
jgi:hypothetical protein